MMLDKNVRISPLYELGNALGSAASAAFLTIKLSQATEILLGKSS